MMEQLKQLCARRDIKITDDSLKLMGSDTMIYSRDMNTLFIGNGITDATIKAAIMYIKSDKSLNILQIIGYQCVPFNEFPILKALRNKAQGDECFVSVYSYWYGFIQGKRAERAKRRRKEGTAI